MSTKKIHLIGIGGIGVSAVARYYLELGYKVSGSDSTNSELIEKLKKEGINITIGENENNINNDLNLVIYSEAIDQSNSEFNKSKELGLKIISYPKALAEIANNKKLITVAGTHGKSTTTSLVSLVLKNSDINFTSVVGTLLKEFDNKNFFHRNNGLDTDYFVIEACEYKRSFLNYKPSVAVITNIEIDHLDYYKDLDDYIYAFEEYINNVVEGGFVILNGEDKNCKILLNKRYDISYIEVYRDYFSFNNEKIDFPIIDMTIKGEHILYDAKIAYIIGHMVGISDNKIIASLERYSGVWRRVETIGSTVYNNILMSDYGHHPTEICLTLKSIKESNIDKKIITVFQPHQYSRTIELLEDFKNSFKDTDILIIPNIYESRDSKEDKEKINTDKLLEKINHKNKINGNGLEKTLEIINKLDSENKNSIILLLGAGDVDNLRYKIKTV